MISAFEYVHTDKALLYRAIMRVFIESKERFVVALSHQEIFDGIRMSDIPEIPEQSEIESALIQLCEWGNLQTRPDTTNVCTVEDFYNSRHTFLLTSQGEAAEKALGFYSENSHREGDLRSSGLADIRFVLHELKQLSRQQTPDAGEVHRNLLVLRALFENLSATAQTFIERLDRRSDLEQADLRGLVDYGRQFIGELELETDTIVELVREMAGARIDQLFQVVAQRSSSEWPLHWERLRSWFISKPGLPSNAERLRERARASLPSLLRIISGIHDQRIQRIDRANDFLVLARWFAQAGSDAEAHVLWRSAFGLCSARHLIINDATLDERETQEIPAHTSWLDAPPLRISMGFREYRGYSRTGGLSRIIDRSAEKEKLAAASHEEARRLLNAQRRFGTGNRIRLSELEHLEMGEFELFLELLGEAVAARVSPAETVEILSSDGCLRVKLEPTGDVRKALILTQAGMFTGPDQWISIEQISTYEEPEVVM